MLLYVYQIVIGDWSDDGHGKCDHYTVETSHNMTEIQEAYLKAVNACGVSLHRNSKANYELCSEYQDNTIPEEAEERLTELGVDWKLIETKYDRDCGMNPDSFSYLFMEMVKTQISDFEYKFSAGPPYLNGYWGKLNHHFGYGCYD